MHFIFPYVRFMSIEIDMYIMVDYNYTFQNSLYQQDANCHIGFVHTQQNSNSNACRKKIFNTVILPPYVHYICICTYTYTQR